MRVARAMTKGEHRYVPTLCAYGTYPRADEHRTRWKGIVAYSSDSVVS